HTHTHTHAHARAHTHAHTSVSPGNLSFYSQRPLACLQEPPTWDLPLSGPRGQMGATEVGSGWGGERRAPGPPLPTTLGQWWSSLSLGSLSCEMGSPLGLAYPSPQAQGQTRESRRRFWKHGSTGRWWQEGS
ncbi:unnamed protein product, partial [Gulo gulo]